MKFEKDTSGIQRYIAFDIHKEYALVGDKMRGRNGWRRRGSGLRKFRSGRKPISVRIINAVVNDPKLIQLGVDVHASHDADAFDDIMRIAAILPPHQLNLVREVLVCDRIVEDDETFGRLNDLTADVLPSQFRTQFFSIQMAVQRIMAEFLAVFGKIR